MMLLQIVQHTPVWVWGLLAALAAYGWSQTRPREMSLTRVTVVPLVLLALSFAGVVSTFAHATVAILAWGVGVGAAIALGRRFMKLRGASWSSETGLLHVPGSWLPMTLMIALFLIKYGVGATLAMNHAMAANTTFAACCGLAYGGFSGLFAARALGLRSLGSTGLMSAAA
jgi:hypothetical protein